MVVVVGAGGECEWEDGVALAAEQSAWMRLYLSVLVRSYLCAFIESSDF